MPDNDETNEHKIAPEASETTKDTSEKATEVSESQDAAEDALAENINAILSLLENPPTPNKTLKNAIKRYQESQKNRSRS